MGRQVGLLVLLVATDDPCKELEEKEMATTWRQRGRWRVTPQDTQNIALIE